MHEKAKESLHKKIIGYLKSCKISEGRIEWSDNLISLGRDLAKLHSKYFNQYDAAGTIYHIAHQIIANEITPHSTTTGNLQEIIGEEKLLALSDILLEYFATLPHPISATLRISSIKSNKEIKIDHKNQLSVEFKPKPPRGLLEMLEKSTTGFELFITTKTHGLASWNADSTSNRILLSSLKILLQQAIQQERLLHTNTSNEPIIASLYQDDHRIKKSEIQIIENISTQREFNVNLPIEICAFLEKLTLPKPDNPEAQVEDLISCFKTSSELIENKSEDGAKIKAAIEWSFDSLTAENQAMAFLKACIGLEALLGESSVDQPLTEMLADRCSYLISGSIAGRKLVKEKFKEIYKTRSKIVHGVVTHMDSMDFASLAIARNFLYAAIRKEMTNLRLN